MLFRFFNDKGHSGLRWERDFSSGSSSSSFGGSYQSNVVHLNSVFSGLLESEGGIIFPAAALLKPSRPSFSVCEARRRWSSRERWRRQSERAASYCSFMPLQRKHSGRKEAVET